ncbi:hypothetical protein BGX30_013234 [Mortierella sp. GBA39]|nr:hypothetical protein BGX30_013234 [Mortierella sp. GBA39]
MAFASVYDLLMVPPIPLYRSPTTPLHWGTVSPNSWMCPDCQVNRQAFKKLNIWRFPDILVVHLKRSIHTESTREKIDIFVDFPIHGLDLSLKDGDKHDVYDLIGITNYKGGLDSGHYTAYAKNERLDQWYIFDDSHVNPVLKEESIKTSSVYILFYRKRNAAVRTYPALVVESPLPLQAAWDAILTTFCQSLTLI